MAQQKQAQQEQKLVRIGVKVSTLVVAMLAFSVILIGGLYVSRFYNLMQSQNETICVTGTNVLAARLQYAAPEDDINALLDEVKEQTGCELTIFEGSARAYTTVIQNGVRVTGTTLSSDISRIVLDQGRAYVGSVTILGKSYLASYVPTRDSAGQVNGALFAGVETHESMRQARLVIYFVLLISVLLIAADVTILISYMRKTVSRPLERLTNMARAVEYGQLNENAHRKGESAPLPNDEVGYLTGVMEETMSRLQGYINEIDGVLNAVSSGDLTVATKLQYVGDFSSIRSSLEHIREQLTASMRQLSASSDQVSAGAEQVSNGAQELSSGASEQAAAVGEMEQTFRALSQRIQDTAAQAVQASQGAQRVGAEISESTRKMDELTAAMEDIRQSSLEIEKIIKTIEDIAFQTNILALNAAVEAARAGAAGKGFAVVADEVRNLATKSAEASQSTAGLIQRSTAAVRHGTQVAGETAEHLTAVAGGAGQMVAAIDQIAAVSGEQSAAVAQVRDRMGQISAVVQANSSTAEESAAASEQLTSQAEMLKQLVGQFRLPD